MSEKCHMMTLLRLSYLVHSLANYALTLPIETGLSTAVLVEIRVKLQFNLETALVEIRVKIQFNLETAPS